MSVDHEALFERVVEIHNDRAWDRLGEVFTDDYVEEYPQSGEVFRGLGNARAIRAEHPALAEGVRAARLDRSTLQLAASDEQWVMTPMYTSLRVEGSGTTGTAHLRTGYPDGSLWWIVMAYELRGGKVARARTYFAEAFEPPDWRAPYREPTTS